MKKKQTVGLIIACVAVIITGLFGVMASTLIAGSVGSVISSISGKSADLPQTSYVGVVPIEGTIGASENYSRGEVISGSTVDIINKYAEDPNNTAIMLYIDSPGGGVNETDEIYLALMNYKQTTGRKVYAWGNDYVASGAYYIACAADSISIMRNTWIGSIGVYVQSVNYAELMKKLGVEGIYIRSSDNKAMGNVYDHLTDEQYAIYQGLVDEAYEQFLGIVASSRSYTDMEQLKKIADGRVYTASQAIENRLADRIESYSEAMDRAVTESGASGYYTPSQPAGSLLDQIFSKISELMPKSDTQAALDAAEHAEVKLYYGMF